MPLRDNTARKTKPLILGGLSALFLLPIATPLAASQIMVKPGDVKKTLSQPASPAPAAPAAPAQPKPVSSPAAQNAPKPASKPGSPLKPAAPAVAQNSATSTKVPVSAKKVDTQKVDAKKVDTQKSGVPGLTPVADHPSGPRRDPFDPLVGKEKAGPAPENLPPGKAGLQITTLRLDGVVRGPSGMIAVVSNPQQRVYFLRDGDHLYDGDVEHITLEGLSFHQAGTDPFGKPVEREVTKRLYPTPGEEK